MSIYISKSRHIFPNEILFIFTYIHIYIYIYMLYTLSDKTKSGKILVGHNY